MKRRSLAWRWAEQGYRTDERVRATLRTWEHNRARAISARSIVALLIADAQCALAADAIDRRATR